MSSSSAIRHRLWESDNLPQIFSARLKLINDQSDQAARTQGDFKSLNTGASSGSSRRLCEKNAPQRTAAAPLAPNSDSQVSPAGKACKIDVCASFYSSFDAATCTYQPYDGGPRRICDR
jgi:hypothetical protein